MPSICESLSLLCRFFIFKICSSLRQTSSAVLSPCKNHSFSLCYFTSLTLSRYEEAADMGSQLAEVNAVFLYDMLLLSDCSSDPWSAESKANTHSKPSSRMPSRRSSTASSSTNPKGSYGQKDDSYSSKQYVLSGNSTVHEAEAARCRIYLNRMADMRLTRLANGGNYYAAGVLADNILRRISTNNSYSPIRVNPYPNWSTISAYTSKLFSDAHRFLQNLLQPSTTVSDRAVPICQEEGGECSLPGAEKAAGYGPLPDVKEAARWVRMCVWYWIRNSRKD